MGKFPGQENQDDKVYRLGMERDPMNLEVGVEERRVMSSLGEKLEPRPRLDAKVRNTTTKQDEREMMKRKHTQ
jgi:hypothetical protein